MNSFRFGGFARSLLLAAVSLVLASESASGAINRWTSNGPYGGAVTALAVDPIHPGTIYASVPNAGVFDPTFPDAEFFEETGVYKTVDGGAHWTLVLPLGSPYVPGSVTIDPSHPDTVYVSAGAMFRTTDGGSTWAPPVAGLGSGPILIDPRNSEILYSSGLLKSVDGGVTWNRLSVPGLYAVSSAMDLAHPDVLYALVQEPAPEWPYLGPLVLYRTQDAGSSWTPVASPAGIPQSVAVDPVTSRVYLLSGGSVFRSADGGATWTKVRDGLYGTLASIRKNEVFVWGGSPLAVIQSKDGGETWAELPPPLPSWGAVAGSPQEPSTVYLGLQVAGVGKSTDGGATWSVASDGISALTPSLAMDPAHPDDLYAGSAAGLFHSADGGGSWSLVDADPSLTKVAIQPGTLALFSKLGRSGDGGVTWQPIPYPDDASVPVIPASAPQVLFVGRDFCRDGLSPYNGEVFRSGDGGQTWNLTFEPPLGGCTSIVASPSGSEIFERVDAIQYGEVSASHDGGASWAPLDVSGWAFVGGTSLYAKILAIDPINPSVVYASNGDRGGPPYRLWVSTIGGGQWRAISDGLPSGPLDKALPAGLVAALVVDPVAPSTLYAATADGVYRSVDGGGTWTSFNVGLPPGPARNLAIDGTGRFLHVTAAGTVYDIEISGGCGASDDALCLLGGRFVVTVQAIDPRTGRLEVGTARPQADRWGYFSLPGFTGDPDFPEIVFKMVDATAIGEGFWVFHSGLTDLEYTLSVFDTVTGQRKSYQNDRSDPQALCGGADTGTFTGTAASPAAGARPSARASAAAGSLPLLGRFNATLSAIDPRTGREAAGVPIARDAKWGYFSLPDFTGDATFPEVFVKMLDATSISGTFWVFHTGLTDLEYTLTVTDSQTGAQRVYRNERSDPSRLCGGADTDAFRD